MTISSTGKSAVSAFTTAEPRVKVAEAASTNRMAWRRAARRSAAGRRTADVSIGRRLLRGQPLLHRRRYTEHVPTGAKGLSLDKRIGRKESGWRQRRNERICKWE